MKSLLLFTSIIFLLAAGCNIVIKPSPTSSTPSGSFLPQYCSDFKLQILSPKQGSTLQAGNKVTVEWSVNKLVVGSKFKIYFTASTNESQTTNLAELNFDNAQSRQFANEVSVPTTLSVGQYLLHVDGSTGECPFNSYPPTIVTISSGLKPSAQTRVLKPTPLDQVRSNSSYKVVFNWLEKNDYQLSGYKVTLYDQLGKEIYAWQNPNKLLDSQEDRDLTNCSSCYAFELSKLPTPQSGYYRLVIDLSVRKNSSGTYTNIPITSDYFELVR